MENKIILITPPDKIFNQNINCLLLYPSDGVRQQAEQILANSNQGLNIYLYNTVPNEEEEHDIDWLLTVAKMSDVVIFDIDNSEQHVKMLGSYLVSLPQTYWLTSEDTWLYNKLSPSRIYGLDAIEHLIGGSVEETKK